MTSQYKQRVSLSVGNWIAILGLLAGQLVAAASFVVSREGRLAALEARVSALAEDVRDIRGDMRVLRRTAPHNTEHHGDHP